ncbi:hypothetical protein PRUPE_6G017900 [Prunus persica]|uniref:ENT domain-containing protein n=1 Tax=Prunus persica TaxID=3760 RepID=A0A251NLJ3_PRUPE|nr:hypothetical protein PRUPE_6G017900 [Prunus persica]
MDYELSDSSGTDDDLPPSHQNRFQRGGRSSGNGRSAAVGSASLPRMHGDMETQIHHIEQEAYCSVLRAFKAQSDAITWDKESLITELRKELRVSDEEHRELLSRVNADDMIRRIREWRKTSGLQPGTLTAAQPVHDPLPSPTVSASRKKQKTSQSVASLSLGAPSPALPPSMQPSSSALRRGPPPGGRTKKPKSSSQYPSTSITGRPQAANRGSSGAFVASEPAEGATYDPLIGRKISPEDIRWEGDDPGISRRGGRPGPGPGPGRGIKKSTARGGAVSGAGRGRGAAKGQSKKDLPPQQNGIGRKAMSDIEILHTDSLIKEVEKVFGASHPDPMEIEKAKKVLKEHEQALVDAIARLEDASDGESDEHTFSQRQPIDQDRGWRKRQYDEMAEGRAVDGANGNKMTREGRIASDDQRFEGDDI